MNVQRPLVAALAVAALAALPAPAAAVIRKPTPTLRVVASEYSFGLSKTVIAPGPRSVVLANQGTRSTTSSCGA